MTGVWQIMDMYRFTKKKKDAHDHPLPVQYRSTSAGRVRK